MLTFLATALSAQTAKLHVSSKSGDRLSAKPDVRFVDVKPTRITFEIDDTKKYQKIAEKQEEVLRALFDPKVRAGYTAMKTPIAGTDFQAAGPWYTYDDTPGEVELKNLSVERDFGPNGGRRFS
jgi:hypothetical protein